MGEIVPPRDRGRVMLSSQILAVAVFGLLGNVPAIMWVPQHYDWFIYLFSIVTLVVLVPLALWGIPESSRWLEAHGHRDEALRVMARLEDECRQRSRVAELPAPEYAKYAVPVSEHVPMRELLRGQYGQRTIVLLIAWTLGYSGMVYGFAGFEPAILKAFGLSPSQTFAVILTSSVLGGGLALAICAVIGESVERRLVIMAAALVNAAALLALFFIHTVAAAYILIFFSWGAETAWLFSMYNYTAASYPTRLRATGTGLTDGVGHLGAVFGPIIAGTLYSATAGAGHYGWFLYIILPGALIPAVLVAWFGIDQRKAILEEISA